MERNRKIKRKRRKKFRRRSTICIHHITYDPPWTVNVWTGEHMILTKLGWRKRISKGCITALKDWIAKNEGKAVELLKRAD